MCFFHPLRMRRVRWTLRSCIPVENILGIDVLDISNPSVPTKIFEINPVANFPTGAGANSVAVNNAFAGVDIASATIEDILPLGTKDYSQDPLITLDPSDRDDAFSLFRQM